LGTAGNHATDFDRVRILEACVAWYEGPIANNEMRFPIKSQLGEQAVDRHRSCEAAAARWRADPDLHLRSALVATENAHNDALTSTEPFNAETLRLPSDRSGDEAPSPNPKEHTPPFWVAEDQSARKGPTFDPLHQTANRPPKRGNQQPDEPHLRAA